jgi:hypothetical protein
LTHCLLANYSIAELGCVCSHSNLLLKCDSRQRDTGTTTSTTCSILHRMRFLNAMWGQLHGRKTVLGADQQLVSLKLPSRYAPVVLFGVLNPSLTSTNRLKCFLTFCKNTGPFWYYLPPFVILQYCRTFYSK